jgi:putative PIN family toxin of toxin-antitoxin system
VRAVLDTNVVLSGTFFKGVPGRILAAWAGGDFELVLSPEILGEYRRAGAELGAAYPDLVAAWEPVLALITARATVVDAPGLPERVGRDPHDEMFLAAALASHARVVVSGDKDLLAVSGWRGIAVQTPRQFHDKFLARG